MDRNIDVDAGQMLDTIAAGGIVAFPVDVGYAIVANTEDAIARIFSAKQRSFEKQCGMFTSREMFEALAVCSDADRALVDVVTRQGNVAHWLYILVEGTAEVRVSADGTSRSLATLHPGDCFGEMGLMTGDPRSATVVALTDATCYRLDKDGFHGILHQRPEIAEHISHLLARRRVELETVKEHLSQTALQERLRKTERDLLHRIRRFFALAGPGPPSQP